MGFRDDVVELGRKVFIRLPLRDAADVVEQRYVEGVNRGLGIDLHASGFLDGHLLCYIWLSKDEEDADYRMLSGLKFSMPAEPERRDIVGITFLHMQSRRFTQ